jgi:agmatinase
LTAAFDPDSPSEHDTLFGLPPAPDSAQIHVLPVPFEATCSYGRGTRHAPEAIRRASHQLDFVDEDFGEVWRCGIHMHEAPVFEHPPEGASRAEIGRQSRRRTQQVEDWTRTQLEQQRIPAILGGDHSCPLGALRAAAAHAPLSILHIDAHMDLREAYEGHEESHASIMHNALSQAPGIERLVQIAIRDFSAGELRRAEAEANRVRTHFARDWRRALAAGQTLDALIELALNELGDRVWISFDIDGLDPAYCPGTGTPVPGGLSYAEAVQLLWRLSRTPKRIVGFDLCEVHGSPTPARSPAEEWDANVAARILYKLCGAARTGNSTA